MIRTGYHLTAILSAVLEWKKIHYSELYTILPIYDNLHLLLSKQRKNFVLTILRSYYMKFTICSS
jgi:hypothetical protein